VHFSTFSVYGETPAGKANEDLIKNPAGDAYGSSKLEAEQLVQEYQAAGLQASILQPTVVYGPWSFWSTHAAKLVSTGTLMLPDLEQGLCNAVYVDDVVEAVLLCLKMEKCLCGPFLISGSEPVKWGEFLKGHAKNPADVTLEGMSAEELAEFLPKVPVTEPLTLRTILPQSFRFHLKGVLLEFPGFKLIYRKLGILRWLNRGARQIVSAPKQQVTSKEKPKVHATEKINKVYPGREHIPLFQSRSSISIEKAAKELGYNPKFNLDSGTKLTRSWLEWANKYN
jgi:nucleoside-diphosphate-sugar epimerase